MVALADVAQARYWGANQSPSHHNQSRMQPRIKEQRVQQMSEGQDVDELHSVFYEDFLSSRNAKGSIPNWLKEQNPDDYEKRLHAHSYHEHVQKNMASWLTTLQAQDIETVPAADVEAKYREFKQEFRSNHQHVQLDSW